MIKTNLEITSNSKVKIIIYATTAKYFKDYIKNMSDFLKKHSKEYGPFNRDVLWIKSNCGCTRKYKKVDDIPTRSIKCKHGIYFIKYEKTL